MDRTVIALVVLGVALVVCGILFLMAEKNVTKYGTELTLCKQKLNETNKLLNKLRARVGQLEEELASREERISELQMTVSELSTRLTLIMSLLNKSLILNGLCTFPGVDTSLCFRHVVEKSLRELDLYHGSELLMLMRWESPVERLVAATRYVLDVMMYVPDGNITIVLPDGRLVTYDDVWKSFQETFLYGGDCEDLSIALGSVLKKLDVGKIYLIVYGNETYSHAFLIVTTWDRVFLIDPANDRINSYTIYVQFEMIKRTDREMYYVWLVPTDIPLDTLTWLYTHHYIDIVLLDSSGRVVCSLISDVQRCAEILQDTAPYVSKSAIVELLLNNIPLGGSYMWMVCDFQTLTCRTFTSPTQVVNYIIG